MGNLFSKSTTNTSSTLGKRARGDNDDDEQFKRTRVEIPPILESEVGIASYLNPDLTGFHCILKNSAEDFLVNEVDLDGHVVRLTSFDQPEIYKRTGAPISDSEFDEKITTLFGEEQAKEFRDFLNHRDQIDRVISIHTTKENRFELYKLISTLETPLKSSVKEGTLTLCWPENVENVNRRVYIDYTVLGGEYLQMNVYKTKKDTMGAVNLIANIVKVPSKQISYAGTKDSRAITVQSMTITKGRPDRFAEVKNELAEQGIYVGDFKFVPKGLTLGDAGGNHFSIVLRDVKGADEEMVAKSANSLATQGFLNYFGMQRFGTSSILTHEIGRKILQKDFAGAVDLIMKPRAGDGYLFDKARKLWAETKNPKEVLAIIPKRANAEIKILKSYERFPGNHQKAIKNIARNMYLLYIHAYQSYIWNRAVSARAAKYGCSEPLIGDVVMVEPTEEQVKNKRKGNLSNNVGRRDPWDRKVPLVLTAENIGNYTMNDVVYPLAGRRTVFPQNEIGDLMQGWMKEDGVVIVKGDNIFDDIPGDYRKILALPENVSWSFIRYNDPSAKLINTDLDTANGEPEPVGEPNGKHLALRVEFTLGSSQYATMALREITRMETSSQSQSQLVHSE